MPPSYFVLQQALADTQFPRQSRNERVYCEAKTVVKTKRLKYSSERDVQIPGRVRLKPPIVVKQGERLVNNPDISGQARAPFFKVPNDSRFRMICLFEI